ncbi:MAG: hypothetical protein J4400_04220 [Candidatus Aenigmarchaeota archaeon]|nr:hypothetical protein [Candidatus Aenigmarchaeota archaeon]
MVWKGWLIDKSLRDKRILGKLKIIDSFVERNGEGGKVRIWKLNIIEVADNDMNRVVKKLEKIMKLGYYVHFTDRKNLVIIFSGRSFRIKLQKILKETKFGAAKFKADVKSLETWKAALEYGTGKGRVDPRYMIKVV